MMCDMLSLIREDLKGFGGYSSAAKEASGGAPVLKLDANESPYPPFGTMASLCTPQNYAEPQPYALRGRMASYWGVDAEEILLTCGSDQAIDCIIRLFCAAGKDEILICPPTFAMYGVYAQVQGAGVLSIPLLANGQLDLASIEKAVTVKTKLVFIPTPNAPTGKAVDQEDIIRLSSLLNGRAVVVADEAYVEFSSNPAGCLSLLNKLPNLVVLRTLSKAHALAGERVGCALAPKSLIAVLRAIVPPYPLSASAVRAAMDAFTPAGLAQTASRLKMTIKERERMREALLSLEDVEKIEPSEGNFLFVETKDASIFMGRLARYGIVARSMDGQRKGAVRLSLGAPEDNDLVLVALGLEVKKAPKSNRQGSVQRQTKETQIDLFVDLDDKNDPSISTGIAFYDHMLSQIATHGGFTLNLLAKGDLEVDVHHTIEDCALALGQAIRCALGDKNGIARFGFTAPLDESLAQIVIDLSGRPYAEIEGKWLDFAGDGMSPDLAVHFFRSFASTLGATLHLNVRGENNHHMIEASFKALGRVLRQAIAIEGEALPSTKGAL